MKQSRWKVGYKEPGKRKYIVFIQLKLILKGDIE